MTWGNPALLMDEDVDSPNDSYYSSSDDDETPLKCFECDVEFTGKKFLHNHLLHHIKQPWVSLSRVQLAPIKITLKSTSANNFEIVSSPQASPKIDDPQDTAYEATESSVEDEENEEQHEQLETEEEEEEDEDSADQELGEISPSANNESEGIPEDENTDEDGSEIMTNVRFSPTFIGDGLESENSQDEEVGKQTDYNHIPGAEPTPPPEPSPEYPKIRIKSGLLKEPLTITEITDDNPNGDYNQTEYNSECTHWATPSLEDPLRLPETGENDSSILSNLFTNNNDRAKDLGFTTSDPEFVSLESSSRTSSNNALQVFNSTTNSTSSNNPLDTLSNLPMQQLAQQVSRLQPSGNNGMHQQNVLINIQQFPQAPPPQPHPYQQVMYPPHPPQPMYHQPYQYQPPNPMYYPQTPAYSHMPPPPRPQMPPPGQQIPQNQQQQQQQQQQANNQQVQYRQPMQSHPRQQQPMMGPRHGGPGSRGGMARGGMQMGPRGGYGTRQPMATRQRAPMSRGRGGGLMPGIRGPRARMPLPNGAVMTQNGPRMMKRSPDIVQNMQAKRKKIDVLVPDKHDDADCQVIAVQPKNTGLPQIQSIQGNCQEPTDNNIMHLSDSITLSVRNPPQKPPSPKKSDAKDVANILATRGITVTATPKSKENKQHDKTTEPPVAINLNSSVCIIPTNKKPSEKMTTVDLTEEPEPPPPPPSAPKQHLPKQHTSSNKVLPFQCDLCPAKYPNSFSLSKHRQTFHKTGSSADYGVPLIDLRTPGIMQRLASLGIHNYIPLPGANPDSTFALPIINSNTYKNGNLNAIGATSVLTLGPIRMFRATQANSK
ncbi:PREDICTED: altered inheritance of mitochondria protein 3-like isoform X2 [Nicrophorus vespilloides]|uniref:Altered inheritance of mitochondria protein 3-like isoform X2 n=1 Tax=Nicrophorus vespilloides TaxID=110193 RepID=A0ABM1MGB8_NICVS|nr:PREDICTED: altered inheritance of mitochondria protein 3-like isoform X2 [Nicrophorus vespilloides]